jgi:GNAT superfamily N-acetyltransferase
LAASDSAVATGWRVEDLAGNATCLPALARLMTEGWPEWYGPGGAGRAEVDIAARCRTAGLPWGVVARCDAGVPVGTGALDATSFGAADATETPWIVGLIVAPDWRRRGIGGAMVAALEGSARAKGWTRLHCATVAGEGMLARRGWSRRGTAVDGVHGVWALAL